MKQSIQPPPIPFVGKAGSRLLHLDNGTPIRLCCVKSPDDYLYCSADGLFCHLRRAHRLTANRYVLTPVKPDFPPSQRNHTAGSCYPKLRYFTPRLCHILMCTAWHGPRPHGYECDHLNGDKLDWRADNLQWVTPAENIKRAKLLRLLRKFNLPYYDEIKFNRRKLLDYFAQYDIAPVTRNPSPVTRNPTAYHLAEFPEC